MNGLCGFYYAENAPKHGVLSTLEEDLEGRFLPIGRIVPDGEGEMKLMLCAVLRVLVVILDRALHRWKGLFVAALAILEGVLVSLQITLPSFHRYPIFLAAHLCFIGVAAALWALKVFTTPQDPGVSI